MSDKFYVLEIEILSLNALNVYYHHHHHHQIILHSYILSPNFFDLFVQSITTKKITKFYASSSCSLFASAFVFKLFSMLECRNTQQHDYITFI